MAGNSNLALILGHPICIYHLDTRETLRADVGLVTKLVFARFPSLAISLIVAWRWMHTRNATLFVNCSLRSGGPQGEAAWRAACWRYLRTPRKIEIGRILVTRSKRIRVKLEFFVFVPFFFVRLIKPKRKLPFSFVEPNSISFLKEFGARCRRVIVLATIASDACPIPISAESRLISFFFIINHQRIFLAASSFRRNWKEKRERKG